MPSRIARPTPRPGSARTGARIGTGFAALAAGSSLLAALAPAAAADVTLTSLLTRGSVGPAVAKVQRALHVRKTGRFNRVTRRAVIRFQRRDGLLIDGIVGPQTWDALFGITPTPTSSTTGSSYTGSSYTGSSSTGSYSNGSSSTTAAPAASSGYSGSGGYTIPSAIVQCESGGNYSAVNPSSGAGGAYQILPSTWQAYGGQGSPQNASKSEQDRIAAAIYANQGRSAWSC